MPSYLKKRSVTISGHQTSVTLENEFWLILKVMAKQNKLSLNEQVTRIDMTKEDNNLSSALRLAVLDFVLHNPTITQSIYEQHST